jgi:hypothetical protein
MICRKKLWAVDTFLDFDSGVNKAVNRLRETLADSADLKARPYNNHVVDQVITRPRLKLLSRN